MKKCVVSFADGAGNYAKALMRLELSLKAVGFNGDFLGFNDYAHIASPHHKLGPDAVPYAFKAHSIKKAIEMGYQRILWCDSAVYATKPMDKIFSHIAADGYLLFENMGFSIGDYTSDACLMKYNMSRETAFESPMIMACVMGFDTSVARVNNLVNKYIEAASDGVSYLGDWHNNDLQVSVDMRVQGHRHDQSVASILAMEQGLKLTNAQSTYFAYVSHKGYMPISESVGLWSSGI